MEALSDLSLALQRDDITLTRADRLIARQIEVFSNRKEKPGVYYSEAIRAVAAGTFCDVTLNASSKKREINSKQFYQGLVDSMTARLISATDKNVRDLVTIVDREHYQGVFDSDHGEAELRALCAMFNLVLAEMKQAFRDYKDSKGNNISTTFKQLLNAVDTIPVSTAACERGFSLMNDICTSLRSQLTVSHLSSLMFINVLGRHSHFRTLFRM